jgi:molybdopterin converting factor small subunit
MRVWIPSPLLAYTGQQRVVEAEGSTLAELLQDLDRRFPGIRFRMIDEQDAIRTHMRIFVNRQPVDGIGRALASDDEVHILQSLSGG